RLAQMPRRDRLRSARPDEIAASRRWPSSLLQSGEQLTQQVFPALLFASRIEQGAEPRTAIAQSIVTLGVRFSSPQDVGQRLRVPDRKVAGVILSQQANRAGDVR